ncbi:dna-directed rna polymerase, partial [Lasius niger]
MTNRWLLHNSFSIDISDAYDNRAVESMVAEKLDEAQAVDETVLNPRLREAKINLILSNAKDVGMRIANQGHNNFVDTILSGSKGDYFNLGQVKGLLGQQIINGSRIPKMVDNGTRTLIHFPRGRLSFRDECESRGFVMSSFYKGVSPREFFFHSMSGRQGVCDTAMTTFMSGYTMRKLVNLMADV